MSLVFILGYSGKNLLQIVFFLPLGHDRGDFGIQQQIQHARRMKN
jgi:hypothetical protein